DLLEQVARLLHGAPLRFRAIGAIGERGREDLSTLVVHHARQHRELLPVALRRVQLTQLQQQLGQLHRGSHQLDEGQLSTRYPREQLSRLVDKSLDGAIAHPLSIARFVRFGSAGSGAGRSYPGCPIPPTSSLGRAES